LPSDWLKLTQEAAIAVIRSDGHGKAKFPVESTSPVASYPENAHGRKTGQDGHIFGLGNCSAEGDAE
jgi:hypothetical protein